MANKEEESHFLLLPMFLKLQLLQHLPLNTVIALDSTCSFLRKIIENEWWKKLSLDKTRGDQSKKNNNDSWKLFYAKLQKYISGITIKHGHHPGEGRNNDDWTVTINFTEERTAGFVFVNNRQTYDYQFEMTTETAKLTEEQVLKIINCANKNQIQLLHAGFNAPDELFIEFFSGVTLTHKENLAYYPHFKWLKLHEERMRYIEFVSLLFEILAAVMWDVLYVKNQVIDKFWNEKHIEFLNKQKEKSQKATNKN